MAESKIQNYIPEVWYGYGTAVNGFILVNNPYGTAMSPIAAMSNTNGVLVQVAYLDSNDNTKFYIQCREWDGSVTDNKVVGFYVMFGKYSNHNIT